MGPSQLVGLTVQLVLGGAGDSGASLEDSLPLGGAQERAHVHWGGKACPPETRAWCVATLGPPAWAGAHLPVPS